MTETSPQLQSDFCIFFSKKTRIFNTLDVFFDEIFLVPSSITQFTIKGASRRGAKGTEALPLVKSKLREKIKYRIVLCLSDLKLRDLTHMTLFYDVTKTASPKIRHQNGVTEIFHF